MQRLQARHGHQDMFVCTDVSIFGALAATGSGWLEGPAGCVLTVSEKRMKVIWETRCLGLKHVLFGRPGWTTFVTAGVQKMESRGSIVGPEMRLIKQSPELDRT